MYVCIGARNMEVDWRWGFYLTLFFVDCCTGFPVNLEDNGIGEHTQLLTSVAAILITVGTIIIFAGCLCCHRRKGFQEFHNTPMVASTVASSEQGHVNPIANGEFTIFTPLHPPINNNVFMINEQERRIGDAEHVDVSRWFDGAKIDFPREKLKYIRELGNGHFGKVVEGAAQDLHPDRTWTPVVVRILDIASSPRDRLSFLQNALFYLAPEHPNILALKGQCLRSAPLLLLQEFCSAGDLKSRLRTVGSEDRILQWCFQLTSALKHLHENNFIHPDLAARNCQLSSDLTLKLGDYSLSFSKYPEDYYRNGVPLIPVRWRSPESLICTATTIQPKPLTKEANVWSLGVVMWEVCENGSQPYGFLTDDDVISRVFGPEGLRLDGPSKPQMYSDYIFRLIKMCWSNKESRPKVAQIEFMLSDLYQVHRNTHELSLGANSDFDQRWESLKPNVSSNTDPHTVNIEMQTKSISKQLSPSLNNLHGSLDNLLCMQPLTKSAKDLNLETSLHFKLGSGANQKTEDLKESPIPNDSLTDSFNFKQASSGSDTEEENWRRKVERGAYSEKVRLKSRSVADLMVLTHVDYSESESETPMPSIDYKSNRGLRKSNLENVSLNFSSEGNLLSLEDTFEQELKKMQVERRDSLLFVPDNKSQNLSVLRELNSTTEIKPPNQIYNVFNVSVDKYRPLPTGINLNKTFTRQDSETKKIDDESDKHPPKHNLPDILASLDEEHGQANVDLLESNLIPAKKPERDNEDESHIPRGAAPDLNESKAEIKESQIVPDLCSENVENSVSINSCLRHSPEKMVPSEPKPSKPDVFTEQFLPEIKPQFIKGPNMMEAKILCSPSPKETFNRLPQLCLGLNEFLNAERKNTVMETPAPSENSISTSPEVLGICDVPLTVESYEKPNSPKVAFDVSDSQQESKPNLLTHALVFSSTPFGKKSSITFTEPPGVNLFDNQTNDSDELFISPIKENGPNQEEKLNYSLETWDNFLGKSFDSNRETNENFFDSFTSEPQSMLFLEENIQMDTNNEEMKDGTFLVAGTNNPFAVDDTAGEQLENQTFTRKAADGTFVIEAKNDSSTALLEAAINETFAIQDSLVHDSVKDTGEDLKSGGGWFLHPQLNNEQLTEELESQPSTSSYIRYGMDDEVVSALRNELIAKLPQAQNAPQENIKEEEEWNQEERNEIFLRYNGYNAMLSPIPEETSFELNDEEMGTLAQISPKYEDSDSDWSDELPPALSSHTNDSVFIKNAQTASQSSCCSNDTLFNFDDFASANEKEPEDIAEEQELRLLEDITDASEEKTMKLGETTESFSDSASNEQKNEEMAGKPSGGDYPIYLNEFLENERNHSADFPAFPTKVVAPLPSPEDKPWKSLPASLITFKSIQSPSLSAEKNEDFYSKPDNAENEDNPYESLPSETYYSAETNLAKEETPYEDLDVYKFPFADEDISNIYENLANNTPHVNVACKSDSAAEESHDMLGVLTDIRFSGPIDSQLMSTSFSESNEAEEQDWESGSDTRSSSSGEFIWKEGEHEESLKALQAVPHEMLEDVQPMGEIVEESTERDISTSSSEEEGDNLEFVPSAWDKFATPSKSALRSPDKSLERVEMKKSKGVWFKKQKYHCVYEYPREPESPVLQSQDLWKPQMDFVAFADWEFDPEICLPPPTAESDLNPSNFTFKPKINNSRRSLYYLTSPIDFQGDGSSAPRTPDYDCQVVPTNRHLDDTGCSQFFPGASSWMENITPDSGLEDCTPVSESSGFSENFATFRPVASLRKLAEQAVNRNKNNRDALGGLRHTRSKLKLDLPPSPSAFTSGKTFVVEPLQELEIIREKPAFSTFGKSRFLVQHVDTPTDENLPQTKNVCFDVLPYKPINIIPIKSETVLYELLSDNFADKKGHFNKGEASLLDSADEDSGIESSTLERKSKAIQRDNVKME